MKLAKSAQPSFKKPYTINSYLLVFIILVHFNFKYVDARTFNKIDPGPALKIELNSVLMDAAKLHEVSYQRNEREVESTVAKLLTSIDRAKKRSQKEKGQGVHLSRILKSAQEHLAQSRHQLGETRRSSLKEAFTQIVEISHMYKLENYNVFFCPKDKSVWLQKGRKAQNPINPERFGDCGKLVN